MAEKSRKISFAQQNAEKGAFLTIWGSTWGLSVYPAYGIDKLKFSFIEKGKQGAGSSFDVYMDTIRDGAQCFDNWAYDITHGMLSRVLASEKQRMVQYPEYYKYATGANGEKTIGICNSQQAGKYVINASISKETGEKDAKGKPKYKSTYANIQCTLHDLRHLAESFQMTYEARRRELAELALANSKPGNNDKAHEEISNTNEIPPIPDFIDEPNFEIDMSETPAGETKTEVVNEGTNTEEKAPVEETNNEEAPAAKTPATGIHREKLKTCSVMTALKNGRDLAIQTITQSGETKNVVFLKDIVDTVDPAIWTSFLRKTKDVEGFVFTADFAETPKGSLVFQSF